MIKDYILTQDEHHKNRSFKDEYRAFLKEYISEFQTEECEPEINVEPWMVNIEKFEQELVKSDPEVEIEEWMYNEYFRLF